MIRKHVYPHIEGGLNKLAGWLDKKNITPNHITLAGTALSLVAGVIYASGHFTLAGIVCVFSCLGDMLDGALARLTGKSSKFGAFLDSTTDRYADVFIFGGLAVYYARQNEIGWLVICLIIIAGAYATSYSKARSENFIDSCPVGIFERPERMIALGFFTFFTFIPHIQPLSLWTLAIGTNYTALQRILYTKRKLSEPSSEK